MSKIIEELVDRISVFPNAAIALADESLSSYVASELTNCFPVIEKYHDYWDYLKRFDFLTIGLGGCEPDDDEIEDDNFSIDPVEELLNRDEWETTRIFDIAWGRYTFVSGEQQKEVWYIFGLGVDEPYGIYQRVVFEEKVLLPPLLLCKKFHEFLQIVFECQGFFLYQANDEPSYFSRSN